jgi:hypothetical protein
MGMIFIRILEGTLVFAERLQQNQLYGPGKGRATSWDSSCMQVPL